MDSLSQSASVLILTSKEEEAEGIVRSLRNGGLAVQGLFTSEPGRLRELTTTNHIELILCCEFDRAIDLDAWIAQYQALQLEMPLVILAGEETDSARLIGALRDGARDLVRRHDTDHLQIVVARELSDFQHRCSESSLRSRLEECEKRSRDLVDAAGEAVAFIMEGMHVQVNPAYQDLFGFDNIDDLDGFPLLDLIDNDFHPEVRDTVRSVERGGSTEPAELDVQCIRADGRYFEAHLSISSSRLEGESCIRIIAETRIPEPQPSSSQSLDADTGLPDRAALIAELESRAAVADPEIKRFAIIYVGILNFSVLLHDLGLIPGLKAAAELGAYLHDLAPAGAYLGRVGDDGYALLIEDLKHTDAQKLTERITEVVPPSMDLESARNGLLQCGTGLTFVDSATDSPAALLDKAYRNYMFGMLGQRGMQSGVTATQESGTSGGDTALAEERRIAERIQHALDVEGFELFYQPIVSLKGDRNENYSVLLRLRGEDGTLSDAKDFLGVANRSGTMAAVDRWVIRNAVAKLAEQRSKGQEINFFVSIAETTLQEEKLLVWICDCLHDCQARGNWLTLQIMEEHARRHAALFTRLNDGLKKVGCRLAIKRFGEGQDPEMLLRTLRPEYVKLPLDLGKRLADDRNKQKRVQELTQLCHDAGVKSVVTGVEDARSLTVLWTAGIDYVQGNFLQPPSPTIDQIQRA
jgi:PAS domain S-box-containing protein